MVGRELPGGPEVKTVLPCGGIKVPVPQLGAVSKACFVVMPKGKKETTD